MPIKIPNDLPARAALEREGVMVMSEATAAQHLTTISRRFSRFLSGWRQWKKRSARLLSQA